MKIDLREAFFNAIKEDNLDKAKACHLLGLDINTLSRGYWTALTLAVSVGKKELFDWLLETQGVDINKQARNEIGELWTPLMFAVKGKQTDMLMKLLEFPGIDLNYQDYYGNSVAHVAASEGSLESLMVLTTVSGIDWNLKLSSGQTPLFLALEKEQLENLRILICLPNNELKCKVNGKSLIEAAVLKGIEYVEAFIDLDGVDWNEKDLAIRALNDGKTEIVKLLLIHGLLDIGLKDNRGRSLESIAREKGMTDVLDLIPGTVENRLMLMEESFKANSLRSQLPECPVCLEQFKKNVHIFLCVGGHFICQPCKNKMTRKACPKCKQMLTGRAIDFEQFINNL